MDWPLALSILAVVVSLVSIAVVEVLARRSPPRIVARAAGQLEAVEADLDARLKRANSDVEALALHVENVLEEIRKSADDAAKRNRAAARSRQAAESAAPANGIDAFPPGHPQRYLAIEKAARERGL